MRNTLDSARIPRASKLLICGLFQKGRVLAQDGIETRPTERTSILASTVSGIEQVLTAPRSPWQNPFVERMIGSIRRECLDHVIVLDERHLKRILRKYVDYYHSCRTHLSLEKDAPEPRRVESPAMGKVRAIPKGRWSPSLLHSTRRCLSRSARDGYGTSRQLTPIPLSRADADPRNVLHEDDPSILVAGSSLISRSSSLWKGQVPRPGPTRFS